MYAYVPIQGCFNNDLAHIPFGKTAAPFAVYTLSAVCCCWISVIWPQKDAQISIKTNCTTDKRNIFHLAAFKYAFWCFYCCCRRTKTYIRIHIYECRYFCSGCRHIYRPHRCLRMSFCRG